MARKNNRTPNDVPIGKRQEPGLGSRPFGTGNALDLIDDTPTTLRREDRPTDAIVYVPTVTVLKRNRTNRTCRECGATTRHTLLWLSDGRRIGICGACHNEYVIG